MDYLRTTAAESTTTESAEMLSPTGLVLVRVLSTAVLSETAAPVLPLQDITNRARRPAKINFFIIKLDER